jgi:5'-phosphate synthase pdxT subunit
MGLFIRAPVRRPITIFLATLTCNQVILSLCSTPTDLPIQVLARIPDHLLPQTLPEHGPEQNIVALRQGRHLLTTFHPELTQDGRFHAFFVKECVLPFVGARAV